MPELPEVETVVRDLRPLLIGRSFARIAAGRKPLRRKWSRAWEGQLLGKRVHAIERRGKWILLELGGPWLLVHLGMTGQFTVANGPRETHTHLVFTLDDGNELRFRDIRRFGSVACYPDRAAIDALFAESGLGPEPFDCEPAYWSDALQATKRNLKAILLDQTIIAGVGNIYADESLFEARLHPALAGQAIDCQTQGGVAASDHRGARPGDRAARLQHPRLRRRLRAQGENAGRIPRLWPNRRAVRPLRNADRENHACGPLDAFLSEVPAETGVGIGAAFGYNRKIRNPNHEIRHNIEYPMLQTKTNTALWISDFGDSDLFRISRFGFRI